jgi:hypothetical protein
MELTVKQLITREEFHNAYLQAIEHYEEVTKRPLAPISPARLEQLLSRTNRIDFSIESHGKVIGLIAHHSDPEAHTIIIDDVIRAPTADVIIIFDALYRFLTDPSVQLNNQEGNQG